jgi:hypothetical protein
LPFGIHAEQLTPPAPHKFAVVSVTQRFVSAGPPAQHPGHVSGSHSQLPFTHFSPTAHVFPLNPQLHCRPRHRSEPPSRQTTHASPSAPHEGNPPSWQSEPAQHPPAQLPSHLEHSPELALQSSFVPVHAWHVPATPQ